MGNFNKFDKNRGGKGFGGGPKQMYPATCSQCGQSCEVPFRPTGDRPVFCNNCFKKQGGPQARFAPKSFGGHKPEVRSVPGMGGGSVGGITKAQFDALNAKLDKILNILNMATVAETPETNVMKTKLKKTKAPAKKSKAKKK